MAQRFDILIVPHLDLKLGKNAKNLVSFLLMWKYVILRPIFHGLCLMGCKSVVNRR